MYTADEVAAALERIAQDLTKPDIVRRLAEMALGWPYVFGAVGELCTPKNRGRRENTAYPAIKDKCQVLNGEAKTCDGCEWKGTRMFDCRGFTYWLLRQIGIEISTVGATTQWNTTKDWAVRGEIQNMPPGAVCCVFKRREDKMSHTGMHIGYGSIIHCSTTVKRGKTDDSGWTHFAIPKGLYTDEELAALQEAQPIHPTLREGDMGESVRQMQVLLIAAGFPCGKAGADGIFGSGTLAAVKSFQAAHGLTVDGIVGRATWAALDKVPDEKPDTWTVHIPGLDKATAEAFAAAYDGAYITGEGE